MREQYLAIGDVHGERELLEKVLQHWNKEEQQLVFVGDLADRGPFSKDCLYLAMKLAQEDGAVYIRGNHEEMLLRYLDNPLERYDHYHRNGGDTTINSLLDRPLDAIVNPTDDANTILKVHRGLVTFLKNRPYVYETKKYIFVHAGLNLSLSKWQETDPYDCVWIREPFHKGKNHTGKTIVFGHTPIPSLPGNQEATHVWVQDHKLGIDGGAVFGGVLHGLFLDEQGIVRDIAIPASMKRDSN